MKILIEFYSGLFLIFISSTSLSAQSQPAMLTIEECYRLAKQNHPLSRKQPLINDAVTYSLSNARRTQLPQMNVSGQASYQSQTVDFSKAAPNAPFSLPTLSKDQYRITADVSQVIYDAGAYPIQRELIVANKAIQEQSVEVSLYGIYEKINQVYFALLLTDGQYQQNELRKSDLQNALEKTTVALDNGTAFRSTVNELKAELLNLDLFSTELLGNRNAYLKMLSQLLGLPLNDTTKLILPSPLERAITLKRPEIKLYDLQKKIIDVEDKRLSSEYKPKLSAFVQAGYGRPTLNFVQNKFGSWWVGGLRVNWSLNSLYTLKNNRALNDISRQQIEVDEKAFLYNLNVALSQQSADAQKYGALLQKDDAIIALRASVAQAAKAQLENGVITVHEYIAKQNAENGAKLTRLLHQIQWLQSQYNYLISSGNLKF